MSFAAIWGTALLILVLILSFYRAFKSVSHIDHVKTRSVVFTICVVFLVGYIFYLSRNL